MNGDVVEIGRRLGHDLFRYRRDIAIDRLPGSVAEGVALAASLRLPKQPVDRFVSKWLQLRINAIRRNRSIDDQVTPDYLRRIDVATCPVTRSVLTHGHLAETDWSVDRINNDGGYAPNNLAVMSVRANRAKGDRSFDEVLALSAREHPPGALHPVEWLRLAAMMLGPCFAKEAGRAPLVPLVAPIAPCTLQPASQVIQYVFTRGVARQAGKNALVRQFRRVSGREPATVRLERFAETMHRGLKEAPICWDVWLRTEVFEAFRAWRASMDLSSWCAAGTLAMHLSRTDRVAPARLGGWQLDRRGYLQ